MKKLLVLSGKGGTGKTTLTRSLIELNNYIYFADCDVDAPNLELSFSLPLKEEELFYGMSVAKINPEQCENCGLCQSYCRFDAIDLVNDQYQINSNYCEGCSVCELMCPSKAIKMVDDPSGDLFLAQDEKHTLATAKLKMGKGNSGKLVTEVKKKIYRQMKLTDHCIIDGSPGIGCPVIASISGVDAVLIVAEPSISGISDLYRIVEVCQRFKVNFAVCINKYDINEKNTQAIKNYLTENNFTYAGQIKYSPLINQALKENLLIKDLSLELQSSFQEISECVKQML